jgi:hypothetical protein
MKFQRSSAFLQAGRDAERGLRYFRGLAAMCGESSSYSRDSETAANERREMMKHEHLDAGPTEEQFQNMLQKAVLRHSSLAVYRSRGTGAYHSLQLSARKRFSSGFMFDFNYTYGRSIDMSSTRETDGVTSGQIVNPWSPRQMRAVSDYDTTHIFTAFFVYELPVGKGKPILGSGNKLLNAFVGGWQLNGIYRQTSGFPVSVGNGGFWPTNWNLSGSATQLTPLTAATARNATVTNGGPYMFANPAAALAAFDFTLPGQSGSRNTLRGDGIFNVDASVSKRFLMPFNERHALQIRAEVFNLTNSTTFDVNTASLSLGSPTTFGKYSSTLSTPRVMQFGAKYIFLPHRCKLNHHSAFGCTPELWGEGHAAGANRAARRSQKSSKRPLSLAQRRAMMALAPQVVQCMPVRFSLVPMTILHPASRTPVEVHKPCE